MLEAGRVIFVAAWPPDSRPFCRVLDDPSGTPLLRVAQRCRLREKLQLPRLLHGSPRFHPWNEADSKQEIDSQRRYALWIGLRNLSVLYLFGMHCENKELRRLA